MSRTVPPMASAAEPRAAARQSRVLVSDNQTLFRQSILRVLGQAGGLRVVAETRSGRAAVDAVLGLEPDIAVVGAEAPDLDGLGVIRALERERSRTRVVLVAANVTPYGSYAALAAGACGYVSRSIDAGEIRSAITAVAAGEIVLAAEAQTAVVDEIVARRDDPWVITPRQARVLDLVAAGLTNHAIAARLRVTPGAVKADLEAVYDRLDAPDRASAVASALRRGLIR